MRWLDQRAFRSARVEFHTAKDPADPAEFHPVLRRGFAEWGLALSANRKGRREYVALHRQDAQTEAASADLRTTLIDSNGAEFRIEVEPPGWVFVYRCRLDWGRYLFARRIHLTLLRIEKKPRPIRQESHPGSG